MGHKMVAETLVGGFLWEFQAFLEGVMDKYV